MIGQRPQIARFQSDFYRDKYKALLRSLLITSSIIVVLIGIVIFLILTVSLPNYYASTTDGKIFSMTAKSE